MTLYATLPPWSQSHLRVKPWPNPYGNIGLLLLDLHKDSLQNPEKIPFFLYAKPAQSQVIVTVKSQQDPVTAGGLLWLDDGYLVYKNTPKGMILLPIVFDLVFPDLDGYTPILERRGHFSIISAKDSENQDVPMDILERRLGTKIDAWEHQLTLAVKRDVAKILVDEWPTFLPAAPTYLTQRHRSQYIPFWAPLDRKDPVPKDIQESLTHIARLAAWEEHLTSGFSLFLKVGLSGHRVGQTGYLSPLALEVPDKNHPDCPKWLQAITTLHHDTLETLPWVGPSGFPSWLISKAIHQKPSMHDLMESQAWLANALEQR